MRKSHTTILALPVALAAVTCADPQKVLSVDGPTLSSDLVALEPYSFVISQEGAGPTPTPKHTHTHTLRIRACVRSKVGCQFVPRD